MKNITKILALYLGVALPVIKLGNAALAKTTLLFATMLTLAGLVTLLYGDAKTADAKRFWRIFLVIVILLILFMAGWTALTTGAAAAACAWLLGRTSGKNRRHIPSPIGFSASQRLFAA